MRWAAGGGLLPLPRGEGRLLLQSAEAVICFRRRTYFSCLAKKSKQKKATQLSATPAGQPASVRLRGAPWNSLRAARCTRTTTASQKLKHACPAARMPPRKHPATGAYRWGMRHGPLLRSAWGRRGAARPSLGADAATARVDVCCHSVEAGPRSAGFGGSGIALFERSEFSETPLNPSTAGCPERSAGTQTVGSPFLW